MTSGDEPQLGGQIHDNAPMISGRGTKIIVSARGAYLAGNLKALLDLLDAERMLIFKQTIIRFAHSWVLRVMECFPELHERIPEIWNAVPLVDQWLAHPDERNEETIREFLRGITSDLPVRSAEVSILALVAGVRYPYPERAAAINLSASVAVECAYGALNPPYNPAYSDEIMHRLDHWHLELAWALLQRQDTPLPPSLDHQNLHTSVTNLPEMYRLKRLTALIYSMTTEQRLQFRTVLLTQAVRDFEVCITRDPQQQALQSFIGMFDSWLENEHRPDNEERQQFDLVFVKREMWDITRWALKCLLTAFAGGASHGTVDDLDWACREGATLAELAARAGTDALSPPPRSVFTARARATHWQVEAAWAILHDQPIPLLVVE